MQSGTATRDSTLGTSPQAEVVRTHLDEIIGSPGFSGAPRLARFLKFVVETALAGDGDQIKESLIAVEVYGRRPDYNPQIDSTVRVEAGRLRSRLRQYYEAAGVCNRVEIELPKGTYAPVFHQRPETVLQPLDLAPPMLEPVTAKKRSWPTYAVTVPILIAAFCAVLFSFVRTPANDSPGMQSIGILPFISLSDHPSTERFSDKLTEDLTTRLTGIAGLRVSARTTLLQYRNRAVDLSHLRRQYGVGAVLEGSVRKLGDRFVVTTQLVDTRNGYHLWADRYERDARQSAAVQNEIAASIASGISDIVRSDTGARGREYDDPKTMDLYHRAQELLRIPVLKNGVPESLPASVVDAVRLFGEVTAGSPRFARGWTGLAEAAEWEYELRRNQPAERLATAKAAVSRAIELEPDLTEAWTLLTSILLYREWNFTEAEKACRRAIELDPRKHVGEAALY